ncbi:MAG: MATE family efflux transporter [Gemmatimonadaceae bacterium]
MTREARPGSPRARPSDERPAAALPLDARDGLATISAANAHGAAGRLVHGSLPRTIATVALPAVASMLLMTLFATVDAFWVGRQIGAEGLAAVSTSLFWIWQVVALAELVSVGLTAVAARRHGRGERAQAARAVGDGLLLALALGAVVAALGLAMLPRLFSAMHAPPPVTALGVRYLGTYLAGCPLIFGYFAVDAGFRASGDTRTPFVLLATSVVIALVLDPVLILGLGPAPALGIAGAALATLLTRGAVFVAGVAVLARRGLITLRGRAGTAMPAIARIGLPTAATGVLFSVIYVVLTRTTTQFGTPALAALGVGHRVESWAYMVGVGFGAAAAAIVGQNVGAGRTDRAERAGWLTVGYATAVGGVASVCMFVFATPLAAVFTDDPAVVRESASYLRIATLSTVFTGAEVVLEGALGGAGATLPPMLTSTALTALRIPLAAWLAPRYGTAGIWWTISLTAVARGLAMMLLWRAGRWKGKSV